MIGDYVFDNLTRRLIHTFAQLDLILYMIKLSLVLASSQTEQQQSLDLLYHRTNILDLITIIFPIVYLADYCLTKYVNGYKLVSFLFTKKSKENIREGKSIQKSNISF